MKNLIIGFFLFLFMTVTVAAPPGQGGGSDELETACEISGGVFTGSSGGNWACCWSDWGCYGCIDSNCKIKCTTKRCRKANGMSRISNSNHRVEGLAIEGSKAPVVPKNPKKMVKPIQTPEQVMK